MVVFAILAVLVGMMVTCAGYVLAQPRLPTPTPSAPQATPTRTPNTVPTSTPTPTPAAVGCCKSRDWGTLYPPPCAPGDTQLPGPCPTPTPRGTPGATPTPTAPAGTPTPTPTPVPATAWTTGVLFPGQIPPYTYYQQVKVYRDADGWHASDNSGWMAGPCEQILALEWTATRVTYRVVFPSHPGECRESWENGGARFFIRKSASPGVFFCSTWMPAVQALTQVGHECSLARLILQDNLADVFLNAPQRDLTWNPGLVTIPAGVVVSNRQWLYINLVGAPGFFLTRYWISDNAVSPLSTDFGAYPSPGGSGFGWVDVGLDPDGKLLALPFGTFTSAVVGDASMTYYRSPDEGKTWAQAGTVPCPSGLDCWDWHLATSYAGAALWQGNRPALVTMNCAPHPATGDWSNGSWGACYAVAPGYALPASWGQQPVAMFPAQAITTQAVRVGPPLPAFPGPLLKPRKQAP